MVFLQFNPVVKKLKTKLNKHWELLLENKECAETYIQKPIIAFRRNKHLKEILAKAKTHLKNNKK